MIETPHLILNLFTVFLFGIANLPLDGVRGRIRCDVTPEPVLLSNGEMLVALVSLHGDARSGSIGHIQAEADLGHEAFQLHVFVVHDARESVPTRVADSHVVDDDRGRLDGRVGVELELGANVTIQVVAALVEMIQRIQPG